MERMHIGLIVTSCALSAGVAVSQPVNTLVVPQPIGGNTWQLVAEFFGPPGPADILTIWSDANFNYASTDGVFTSFQMNQGYETSLLGPPVINGIGTSELEIRATMPAGPIVNPDLDSSNPLVVATFEYTGTPAGLISAVFNGQTRLVGQNSIAYELDTFPNAQIEFYQDAFGNPGERTLQFFVPTPAASSLLGIAGLVATRRRR